MWYSKCPITTTVRHLEEMEVLCKQLADDDEGALVAKIAHFEERAALVFL